MSISKRTVVTVYSCSYRPRMGIIVVGGFGWFLNKSALLSTEELLEGIVWLEDIKNSPRVTSGWIRDNINACQLTDMLIFYPDGQFYRNGVKFYLSCHRSVNIIRRLP